MKLLQESILANCEIKISFFNRYGNDYTIVIPKDYDENIQKLFNSDHENLHSFDTICIENDNKINFLDLTLF